MSIRQRIVSTFSRLLDGCSAASPERVRKKFPPVPSAPQRSHRSFAIEKLLSDPEWPHSACHSVPAPFQDRVAEWMRATFDDETVANKVERNHRFLEESLELVQALDCTKDEAHMLVDYVFGRAIGECRQETGGVMVTLAALCNANDIRMNSAAETELDRCWTKIEQIRAKQATKPRNSPLPGSTTVECQCFDCSSLQRRMSTFIVCPDCGNKRCPKASSHLNECTNSNEPGQPGSRYF